MTTEPDWPQLVDELSQQFGQVTQHVSKSLRYLVERGREIVGCSEAALMVPTADGAHLRFLVSVNSRPEIPAILADIEVPCDRSLVGCVYNTGQLIAIANPDDFYQEVDAKTGLKTSIYMVVPVMDEDETLGVATFMNRAAGEPQEPFGEEEIQAAQQVADLAVAGLRYYERLCLQQQLFASDLARTSQRLAGTEVAWDANEIGSSDDEFSSPLVRAISHLEKLPRREQTLAAELIDVLASHAEIDT